jgi:hypothetical protein
MAPDPGAKNAAARPSRPSLRHPAGGGSPNIFRAHPNEYNAWGRIAHQPEWGLFKFGHTDPIKSNSGLQAFILMAYEFAGKQRGLTVGDITDQRFQDWLWSFGRGITRRGSDHTHSTGTLMEEMVLRGPPQYDCLVV